MPSLATEILGAIVVIKSRTTCTDWGMMGAKESLEKPDRMALVNANGARNCTGTPRIVVISIALQKYVIAWSAISCLTTVVFFWVLAQTGAWPGLR